MPGNNVVPAELLLNTAPYGKQGISLPLVLICNDDVRLRRTYPLADLLDASERSPSLALYTSLALEAAERIICLTSCYTRSGMVWSL